MDDSMLLAPLATNRANNPSARGVVSKLHRDYRKSTVVSERVYMALQRGSTMARSTLEVNDLLDFVTQIPALKVYSTHLRRSLCEQATLVHFEQGQRICTQGDFADAFYVILTGAVQVFREPEGGRADDDADAAADADADLSLIHI